jgi:hypothetical protein
MADGAITPSTADPIGRWVVGPARRLLPRREDRTIRCVASGYQTGCSTLHTSSNQRVSELAGDVTRREPKPSGRLLSGRASSWFSALMILLIDPAQAASGPVGPVLVEDRPPPRIGLGAHHPRLGEDLSVRDRRVGMGAAPFADLVGDIGDPGRRQ